MWNAGTADLAGVLRVKLLDTIFSIAAGETFDVLTAATILPDFDHFELPLEAASGPLFDVQIVSGTPMAVRLTALADIDHVPEPLALTMTWLVCLIMLRRKLGV